MNEAIMTYPLTNFLCKLLGAGSTNDQCDARAWIREVFLKFFHLVVSLLCQFPWRLSENKRQHSYKTPLRLSNTFSTRVACMLHHDLVARIKGHKYTTNKLYLFIKPDHPDRLSIKVKSRLQLPKAHEWKRRCCRSSNTVSDVLSMPTELSRLHIAD